MQTESTSAVVHDRPAVDLALLAQRLIVGGMFTAYGGYKVLSLTKGDPAIQQFISGFGPVAYLVIAGEFLGGLGVMLGFLTRFSALCQIVIMIGAIVLVHLPEGFFGLKGGGYGLHVALIGLLLTLVIAGPGRYALGRLLPTRRVVVLQ